MRKHRALGRYFFRAFFTTVAVVATFVFFQVALAAWSMWNMNRNWPSFVANDYMTRVMEMFSSYEDPTIEEVFDTFTGAMDNKVSGLLIRNLSDNTMFIYGHLPREENPVGMSASFMRSVDTSQDVTTFTKQSAVFSIDITVGDEGFSAKLTSYEPGLHGYGAVTYTVPSFIRSEDIAATVFVTINDDVLICFDLLVINMHNYESTRYVVDAIVLALVWMLPVGLVASLIVALVLSRKNSRSISEIEHALDRISHGENDVSIPPQKVYELDEIARSIRSLDESLKRNKIARKEWIRSIAHDLNTPITSLYLMVEGLKDGVFQPDSAFLEQLSGEITSLSERIDTVRYYASLLDPDLKLDRQSIDLATALAPVLSSYDSGTVRTEVVSSETVLIDGSCAERAVKEVVDNALSYGSQALVRIEGHTVTVTNPGHLPPGHPDLFEPWARGDRSRHSGGSGLGLPITGQIMSLLSGQVEIAEQGENVVVRLVFASDVEIKEN